MTITTLYVRLGSQLSNIPRSSATNDAALYVNNVKTFGASMVKGELILTISLHSGANVLLRRVRYFDDCRA